MKRKIVKKNYNKKKLELNIKMRTHVDKKIVYNQMRNLVKQQQQNI